MKLSRRTLIMSGTTAITTAAAGAVLLARHFSSSALKQSANEFYRRLPIPQLLDSRELGNNVSISAKKGLVEFIEGFETETYGYSAPYLGPAIRVYRGDLVTVKVSNELDTVTSVHWHGLFLASDQDSGLYNPISPGQSWEARLKINQPSSTAWFHPHLYGSTGRQVYMGLAGLLYIEDEPSRQLALPNRYGIDDIPLVLQDRAFDDDGQFLYDDSPAAVMCGSRGDSALVNGVIGPVAEVPKGIVRLRVLNAANARIFRLRYNDERDMHVVANDNGFISAPTAVSELMIAPGERYEILVDFSDGEVAALLTYPDHNGAPSGAILPALSQAILDLTDALAPIARFDPIDELTPGITSRPAKLVALPEAEIPGARKRRFFLLDSMSAANARFIQGVESMEGMDHSGMSEDSNAGSGIAMGMKMGINGKTFDKSRVDVLPSLGDKEIWEVRAMEMAHPFHIHGASFRILSLDGNPPPAHLAGQKDTVLINEWAELLISFDQTADPAKPFSFHCHILEHEDAGMMGQYVTI
jgi:FtsP/CotA-like multicopper oxidase with cupredoxin domain